jgi:hypothetical protein
MIGAGLVKEEELGCFLGDSRGGCCWLGDGGSFLGEAGAPTGSGMTIMADGGAARGGRCLGSAVGCGVRLRRSEQQAGSRQ